MNASRKINILVKVMWILELIFAILLAIGVVGCALGLGIFAIVKDMVIDNNGGTITTKLLENGVSINTAYTGMAIGLFSCLVLCGLSFYQYRYFKSLDNNVRYTRSELKRFRKVGLVNIIVNLASAILIGIGIAIARGFDNTIKVTNYGAVGSIAFGITLLIISLFIEYIVEKEEGTSN